MYINKIETFVLNILLNTYSDLNLNLINKDGLLIQKSPDSIDSDFGTSLPLRLAKTLKRNPLDIANLLAEKLRNEKPDYISEITVVKPGYINFTINKKDIFEILKDIAFNENPFSDLFNNKQQKIQIEFVSANPTGPLHVGHIRGAVYGSALSKILSFYGYDVKNEYYVNDAGNQILTFGLSILNEILKSNEISQSHRNKHFIDSTDSYKGEYVKLLANKIKNQINLELNSEDLIQKITQLAVDEMLSNIKEDLSRLNVYFDEWFHETKLFEENTLDIVIEKLKQINLIINKDGATWFLSEGLGDDRDNVLIKQDSSHTYFFSDIANHYNKFYIRNFDKVINIWGADHQGHIKRTKLAMEALGVNQKDLEIKISQMVTIKKGNELVKISKRSGEYVTLNDIVSEVGSDACRYFFLSRAPNTQLTFDIESAKIQNSTNPVYYIQYAHARLTNLIEKATQLNISLDKTPDLNLLSEKEISISMKLIEFPEIIDQIAKELEPHHITRYTHELASEFHTYYQSEKIIEENNIELSVSRILLCKAILNIIRQCLDLMMVSAPTKM